MRRKGMHLTLCRSLSSRLSPRQPASYMGHQWPGCCTFLEETTKAPTTGALTTDKTVACELNNHGPCQILILSSPQLSVPYTVLPSAYVTDFSHSVTRIVLIGPCQHNYGPSGLFNTSRAGRYCHLRLFIFFYSSILLLEFGQMSSSCPRRSGLHFLNRHSSSATAHSISRSRK